MKSIELNPLPLTRERFATYGDVIQSSSTAMSSMNDARFERFDDLAKIDVDMQGEGHVAISIVRSKQPSAFPHRFDLVERHPLGSQAFIPLSGFRFVVVVAPPGETVEPGDLQAFVTNGRQGINYHRGTWHMPLLATGEKQEWLLVDRAPGANNCEVRVFDQPLVLHWPD